jgi:hypothetical protein
MTPLTTITATATSRTEPITQVLVRNRGRQDRKDGSVPGADGESGRKGSGIRVSVRPVEEKSGESGHYGFGVDVVPLLDRLHNPERHK